MFDFFLFWSLCVVVVTFIRTIGVARILCVVFYVVLLYGFSIMGIG